MEERIDCKLLSTMVRRKCITSKEAINLVTLPLIKIPLDESNTDWINYVDGENKQDIKVSMEEFYFHECVLWFVMPSGEGVYAHLNLITEINWELTFTTEHSPGWKTIRLNYVAEDDQFSCNLTRFDYLRGYDAISKALTLYQGQVDHWIQISMALIRYFQEFCRFNDQQDRYAIAMTPQTRKRTNGDISLREKLVRLAGPSVVYLDKLPTNTDDQSKITGLTGREVSAHPRRGFHYTLKHERYKNHPDYLVHKKMYRKPTWVGDRSTIVNGTVYTVVDKDTSPLDDSE